MRVVPTFSVIIPTRDRNELLSLCLDRLAPGVQQYPAELYDIIVADDSPTESARELLRVRYPWARWIGGPRRGPASNRNRGVTLAHNRFLVFLDDDCVPDIDLLAAYAGAIHDGVDVYEGKITCRDGSDSPRMTAPVNLTGGSLWSCNFAIRREAFVDVAGFDERFPLPHMEDVDLRDRLLAADYAIEFVPGASVDHPPRRLPWGLELGRMHKAGVLYMVLHPPTRSLAWFLQNQLRARVSHVVHAKWSFDSLSALASIPFELLAITLNWNAWMRWARIEAALSR